LTNAAKYSDPEKRNTLTASAGGSDVVVRVQDCGQGIEPEMLEAVFDHFVQQRQSIERAQGGLGLGLAIVKNLVLLHGGTVRAFSEGRGKGSEFVVQLPLSVGDVAARYSPEPDRTLGSAAASTSAHLRKRVLVVDDNQDAADMLLEALDHLRYEVRTASEGPSALGLAADFAPDIALLDIGLPVMDGYELGRRLREQHPAVRLVALTGYGQARDKAQSKDAGFDAHLVKPIHLDRLGELMTDLLSLKG
jgi:CheY-like chemotaxis protein